VRRQIPECLPHCILTSAQQTGCNGCYTDTNVTTRCIYYITDGPAAGVMGEEDGSTYVLMQLPEALAVK